MNPRSLTFTRWLVDDLRISRNNILKDVLDFQLINETDLVKWKLGGKDNFSVSSVYNSLTSNDAGLKMAMAPIPDPRPRPRGLSKNCVIHDQPDFFPDFLGWDSRPQPRSRFFSGWS